MTDDDRGKLASTLFAAGGVGGHFLLMLSGGALALATGGAFGIEVLRDGGWMMMLMLPSAPIAMLVLFAVGIWFARSEKSWSWAPALPMFLVSGLTTVGVWLAQMQLRIVLSGSSIDPAQRAAISAAGIAEILTLTVLGAFAGLFIASAAATVHAARALSRVGVKRFGLPAAVALGLGLASLLAVTITYLAADVFRGPLPLAFVPAVTGMVSVIVASMALVGPRGGQDDPAGALGDLLLCAAWSVVGVGLAATFSHVLGIVQGFAALAGAGTGDGAAQVRMIWAESAAARNATWLFAVPAVLSAVAAAVARMTLIARGAMRVAGGLIVIPMILVVAVLAPYLQQARLRDTVETMLGK